jgi:glycerol-3-phosphate dehydrogenase (NAD(P)+)
MFGNMIGKGYTVKSAMMEMNMVAEGYYAAKSAFDINEKNTKKTKIPIIKAVYSILYQNAPPKITFQKLCEQLN